MARVANRWHGDSPRIEHWTNAVEQAVHAAENALADRRLTALYRRGDRVVACLAVNQPRALIKYRKLLAGGAVWEAAISGTAVS